jgi:hypothetical protein
MATSTTTRKTRKAITSPDLGAALQTAICDASQQAWLEAHDEAHHINDATWTADQYDDASLSNKGIDSARQAECITQAHKVDSVDAMLKAIDTCYEGSKHTASAQAIATNILMAITELHFAGEIVTDNAYTQAKLRILNLYGKNGKNGAQRLGNKDEIVGGTPEAIRLAEGVKRDATLRQCLSRANKALQDMGALTCTETTKEAWSPTKEGFMLKEKDIKAKSSLVELAKKFDDNHGDAETAEAIVKLVYQMAMSHAALLEVVGTVKADTNAQLEGNGIKLAERAKVLDAISKAFGIKTD